MRRTCGSPGARSFCTASSGAAHEGALLMLALVLAAGVEALGNAERAQGMFEKGPLTAIAGLLVAAVIALFGSLTLVAYRSSSRERAITERYEKDGERQRLELAQARKEL